MKSSTSCALLAACLWTATTAVADVAVLTPALDTTLYEDPVGALGNGSGDFVFTGTTASGLVRRAVLAFDVAAALPAGSTVNSVQLYLSMNRTVAGATDVALYGVLADWGEGASDAPSEEGGGAPAASGDATWIHRFFDTSTWSTAGGDIAPTPDAFVAVGSVGSYTWGSTPEMVARVQSWLDDPAANFGWMVRGDETEAHTAKRFLSRENPDSAGRPELIIDFTPLTPSAPGIPTLTTVGLLITVALLAGLGMRRLV